MSAHSYILESSATEILVKLTKTTTPTQNPKDDRTVGITKPITVDLHAVYAEYRMSPVIDWFRLPLPVFMNLVTSELMVPTTEPLPTPASATPLPTPTAQNQCVEVITYSSTKRCTIDAIDTDGYCSSHGYLRAKAHQDTRSEPY